MRTGDAARAYAALSETTRRSLPEPAFVAAFARHELERAQQVKALDVAVTRPAGVITRARVPLGDDLAAQLVREADGWRLEAPLLVGGRSETPGAAIGRLAAALEARDVDAALRLLTDTRRASVGELLDRLARGLAARAATQTEVTGDRARVKWHDGKSGWKLELRRENGEWRVDDIDVTP